MVAVYIAGYILQHSSLQAAYCSSVVCRLHSGNNVACRLHNYGSSVVCRLHMAAVLFTGFVWQQCGLQASDV